MSRQYMTTPEAAEYTRRSVRSVLELTRTKQIPHRRIRGTRACLYVPEEIDAWLDGAELEVISDNGTRIVRPADGVA